MSAIRLIAGVVLTAAFMPQAVGGAVDSSRSPTSTVFPASAETLERGDWERKVVLKVAAPSAIAVGFVEPQPRPPAVTPTRAIDTWLMLLVSALLIAHQLRRKQRSLNQRLTH